MKQLYLNVADLNIKINLITHRGDGETKLHAIRSFEKQLTSYLKGFLTDKKFRQSDFVIDIDSNYKIVDSLNVQKNGTYALMFKSTSRQKIVTFYQISIYQFRLILNSIIDKLLSRESGISLHSSAILNGSSVDLFLGKSGAGKSTISNLLNGAYIKLADDISFIKEEKSRFHFYDTPDFDKNFKAGKPHKYLLGHIYFIKQANFFETKKMTKIKALDLLLKRAHIYSKKSVKTLMKLTNEFDEFHLFKFAKDKNKLLEFYEGL